MTITLFTFLTATTDAGALAILAFKITVVIALGLLLWAALRRASASARHLVLGATLIAAVLIPLIPRILPPLTVPVIQVAPEVAKQPVFNTDNTAVLMAVPVQTTQVDKSLKVNRTDLRQPPAGAAHLLWLVYGAIIFVIIGHLCLGLSRLWWISTNAIAAGKEKYWQDLAPAASARGVQLLVSDLVSAPFTWGIFRPVIVMPASAACWSMRDRSNALAHELSHVERHDWIFQIIARLICAIYWFNPLVWFTCRQMILEAERAADDRVLLSGTGAHDYAQQLVDLTRTAMNSRDISVAATTMAAKNLLHLRVRSILDSGAHRMPLRNFSKYAVIASIAITSLVIGSAQLVAAPHKADGQASKTRYASATEARTTPLIYAVANGDLAEVRRLITEGADVNETHAQKAAIERFQRTALTTATRAGYVDIVATLIAAGAQVDRVVKGDASALIEALRNGHEDIARLLIERGASVSLTVNGDGSPLISAVQSGDKEMVALLLEKGADPNDWVRGDESALFHAAANGDADILRLLIDAGVDVNKKMPGDGNALITATRNGHKEAIELLLNAGARADEGVRGDGNALIAAAKNGDVESLSRMIATGADVNASVKGDGSALIIAARNGHLEAVRLLLQHGADIDKVVHGDETALIGAAWAGDLEMVNYLLAAGANPNIVAPTWNGQTRSALSQASLEGHSAVIDALRAAGARQ